MATRGRAFRRWLAATVLMLAFVVGRGPSRVLSLWTPGRLPHPEGISTQSGPPMTVLTLNVLCAPCNKTGYDPWEARLPALQDIFARHDPDLAAIQELSSQRDVAALLPETHTVLAHPLWPDSAIFYRTARFAVVDSGQLWLSPQPLLPLSRPWRPALPRLVQWAILTDRQTGGALLFGSTHLDGNLQNKDAAARLIGAVFPPLARQLPVILAGDLNTAASDTRFDILRGALADAGALAAESRQRGTVEGIPHTRRELRPGLRIDHILLSEDFSVSWLLHDAPTYGTPARRPSDHPVIVAEVAITAPVTP